MAAPGVKPDRKGHVCPPSGATHPSDRWESLFVYSFILKFTNVKEKTLGFESPMDLEDALMSREPNDILTKILARFILNLKPQTRNLNIDQISTTLMGVLAEYFKTNERTVFWDDDFQANVDPFQGMESGFFAADWDFKLKILRQLVELQLAHSQEIKAAIDHGWGVVHNKHKKEKGAITPINPGMTRETLDFLPFGMDYKRERYWIVDDSPRIYTSTNPWRLTASFKAVSSTREEYLAIIEHLKSTLPKSKGKKRLKSEQCHVDLIRNLEERIEMIDQELSVSQPTLLDSFIPSFCAVPCYPFYTRQHAIMHLPFHSAMLCIMCVRWVSHASRKSKRLAPTAWNVEVVDDCTYPDSRNDQRVAKVRKKIEQNRMLMVQAELRSTRTRRQAQKPDYVYYNQDSEASTRDEYQFQEQEDDDFEDDEEREGKGIRQKAPVATRRSTRMAVLNANGKREGSADSNLDSWRGERRSARLGFRDPFDVDERPPKRARTKESTTSIGSADASSTTSAQANDSMDTNENGIGNIKVKKTGAAALKPTEVAMEQVAGKKKSKFWVYAVEPIPGQYTDAEGDDVKTETNDSNSPAVNGHGTTSGYEGLRVEQGLFVESTA
ncbi:hypothetical protein D9756_005980 [Leucocoprinus leucothites]|uniref:WHIM1 domain-containing protein n=1 Tax=Leucocoprinus leucothites TaxID=201217 RepID=A0A8H5D2C9_9AGAR|nr:hypothetical protein D9756_005980 [Leucoagaricus leucothites]